MADVIHSTLTAGELHDPFHFVGTTEPASPASGQYWLDTDDMVVRRYNGSAWVVVSPSAPPLVPTALPVYAAGDFIDPWVGGIVSGTVVSPVPVAAQQSYAVPIYLAKDCDLNGLAVVVSIAAAAGKRAKMALCTPDANGLPGTVVASASGIPLDVAGTQVGAISYAAAKGAYWVALIAELGGEFETVSIQNPVSTPMPYLINTGAAKSMLRVASNYANEFGSVWNQNTQTPGTLGYAYRFGVRIGS